MDKYLEKLISHWHSLKKMEGYYDAECLKAEEAIQKYLQKTDRWIYKGTMQFDNLIIQADYTRKWDQKLLEKLKAKHKILPTEFPFTSEYKELKTRCDYLEAKESKVWEILSQALVVYPNRPFFFTANKGE